MGHGGSRPGAGRKSKEATKVIRIPVGLESQVRALMTHPKPILAQDSDDVEWLGWVRPPRRRIARPIFISKVPAGFPSPADDYSDGNLDLNEYLVENEAATFYVRVKGHSMIEAGILDGDILAVDRSLTPRSGDTVVAVVDNEMTVKELSIEGETVKLLPRNASFQPITLKPGQELTIWGVVHGVVRKFR